MYLLLEGAPESRMLCPLAGEGQQSMHIKLTSLMLPFRMKGSIKRTKSETMIIYTFLSGMRLRQNINC